MPRRHNFHGGNWGFPPEKWVENGKADYPQSPWNMGFRSFPFSPYSPLDTLFHQGFDPSVQFTVSLAGHALQRRVTTHTCLHNYHRRSQVAFRTTPSSLALTPFLQGLGRYTEFTAYSSLQGSKLSGSPQVIPGLTYCKLNLKKKTEAKTKRKSPPLRSLGSL